MEISTVIDINPYLTNDGMKDNIFNSSSFYREHYDTIGAIRIRTKYYKSKECSGFYKGP